MALNGGGGLVFLGDKLVAGEIREPYVSEDNTAHVAISKTVSAAAHAQDPTSPTQIMSSTPETYKWLWVSLATATGGAGLDGRALLEIWFGAAGSEVKQATFQIGHRNASASVFATVVSCPFLIPSGTRVSCTTRSARTGQSVAFTVSFGLCDSPVVGSPVTCTVDTSASKGIILNNHASANSWSTWKEIWSSTPEDFQGFHIGASLNGNTTATTYGSRIQLGVGADGAEVPLGTTWNFEQSSTETCWFRPGEGPYYFHSPTPSGSRIAARIIRTHANINGTDLVVNGIPI
jgi:hypothetical protein